MMDRRSLRAALAALGLMFGLLAHAATGWRYDGSAVRADATAPLAWSADHRVWSAPLGAWGNASPIVVGGKVIATAEPTTLVAVDAASGRLLWRSTNDYIDTLPAADRPALQARIDALPGLQQALADAVKEVGRLRKVARSADAPPDTATQLQAMTQVMDALKSQIDGLAPYITPPDKDIIGYASPTPTSDGSRVYSLFGQGVASAHDLDGHKLWTVWLGRAPRPMRGYEMGSVASPLLADGALIVAHNKLVGLDPASGRTLWTGPEWRHYGSPAIATVAGVAYVLTPDGKAYRARDGREAARDLADLWYVGPIAAGDRAYWIGGFGHENDPNNTRALAWRLAPDGAGGLTPTKLWERTLDRGVRIYAAPVVHAGLVYVVDRFGGLMVLDAETGADVQAWSLADKLLGTVFANPVIAGDRLVITSEPGNVVIGTAGRSYGVLAALQLGEVMRATPWFQGDRVIVRTASGLACYR